MSMWALRVWWVVDGQVSPMKEGSIKQGASDEASCEAMKGPSTDNLWVAFDVLYGKDHPNCSQP